MMNIRTVDAFRTVLAGAMAAAATLHPSGFQAQKPDNPCALETSERIVAVADVHGAYDRFVKILQEAKLIGPDLHWIGGKTVFVQTGDMMDRGPDSRKALDLLRQLETEAPKDGGHVHALIGNHEAMRLQEFLRDSSAEEATAFRSPDSEKSLQKYYLTATDDARAAAQRGNKPFDEKTFKQTFMQSHPLGWVEMMKAFDPDGEYGKWIREHDAMVKINGIVFMHGGPSPATAAMGCDKVNSEVRHELQRVTPVPPDLKSMLIWNPDGPLWYRGLVDGTAKDGEFESTLQKLGAKAVVVGHTPYGSGAIKPRYDNRLFPIDTGMLGGVFYENGVASALEIVGDTFTAIYEGKREVLRK